jgi:hypothetical protein
MLEKPPARIVRKLQKYLYDYLSVEVDAYDFPNYFLEEWGKEAGVEIDENTYADSLTASQLKAYEQWLIDREKGVEWVTQDPLGSAAYLTLNEVSRMPAGTWGIHFTNQAPFDAFDRGVTLDGLQLSTWLKEKVPVDCKKNLSDELGTMEYVWTFAFEALGHPRGGGSRMDILSYGKPKYGDNALLFQTDGAVRAWHVGDEEYQLILPACSEYSVVPLLDPYPGEVGCTLQNGQEVKFDTVEDLIKYLEKDGQREVGKRIRTLEC